ncbi:hypothetical protein [Kribbella sp. NPDC048928]|uniref:hypothetical protein n=1 Tax=Kribbella sp. NPDC048928 TaxID=3364111 RepID=UPI00371F23D8
MTQPSGIPVSEVYSLAAAIESKISPLSGLGAKFTEVGAHINREFRHLNDCYQAPEREQLVNSTQRIQDSLGEFGPKLPEVAQVLAGFAIGLRAFARQLNDLRNRAYALEQAKNKNPDWQNDQALIDESNAVTGNVSLIITGDANGGDTTRIIKTGGAAMTIPALALNAANDIAALYGGRRWQANGQHEGDIPPPGPTKEERQKALQDFMEGKFPTPPPPPPWGGPVERDYPWYQDVGNFLLDVGEGIVTGLGGMVEGLLTLVPVLPALASIPGVRDFAKDTWGWDMPTFHDSGEAWKGLAKLGAAVVTAPVWVTWAALDGATGQHKSPKWMQDMRETATAAAKGFTAWDEWGKNPGKAFGMVLTNVVTTVAGGGVIAEAKAASMASKFGRAAPVVAKGIDAVNYLRGTRAAMHDATLGLVMKIPKVSSVVEGLAKIPIVGGTFRMQNTPKIDLPATHGLDGGATHPTVELPSGHPSIPVTHVPSVEPITTPTLPDELTTPRTPPARTEPDSRQGPSTTPPGSTPPGSHPETVVPPPFAPIPATHNPPPAAPIGRTDPNPGGPTGRTDPGTTTPGGRTEPGTTTPGGRTEPGTTTSSTRPETGTRTDPGTTGNRTDPGASSRTDPGSRTPDSRTDPGRTPDPSSSKADARPTVSNDPRRAGSSPSDGTNPTETSAPDPSHAESTSNPVSHPETSPDPTHTGQSTPDPTHTGQSTPDPTRTGQSTPDPTHTGQSTPDPARTESTPSAEGHPARPNEPAAVGRTADPVVPPPIVPPPVMPMHAGEAPHPTSEHGTGRDAAGRDSGSRGRIPDTLDGRRPTIPERLDGDPVPTTPRQSIPDRLAGKEPTIPERLEGVQPVRGRTPEPRREPNGDNAGDGAERTRDAADEPPRSRTDPADGTPEHSADGAQERSADGAQDRGADGAPEHNADGTPQHSHADEPVVEAHEGRHEGQHGSQPDGEPQVVPQTAHAGHADGGKKFDGANDPRYDSPVERQRESEKYLPDHLRGGEGRDPATVDPGSFSDHDPTGRYQDELEEGVGSRRGEPRERAVHSLKRLLRWAHKINLFDGSRALKMNCAEITRRFCDILNGDAPRVAKGNRSGNGEWHDVTLEHMGLGDFPPENTFVRPPGHEGDFAVDHHAFQLVRDRLQGRPPGTHANIGVAFKQGGHRFAAFVDLDGSVKWFDGQISEAARKLKDGSPEQIAAIMRDMVKDGSKLPLPVNIEHLHFAVREPGGHWEGPPRTAEHESAAVMRHLREESRLKPSAPLDLDAPPPNPTMSEWFAAHAEHNPPAAAEPAVWEHLQGGHAGRGSDDGTRRPEWQQASDGSHVPPRNGPAAPGDPWRQGDPRHMHGQGNPPRSGGQGGPDGQWGPPQPHGEGNPPYRGPGNPPNQPGGPNGPHSGPPQPHGQGNPPYERGPGNPPHQPGGPNPPYQRGPGNPPYQRGPESPPYQPGGPYAPHPGGQSGPPQPHGQPQWEPPRADQRRNPAGPAGHADPWDGGVEHWPQDFGPTGTPGGPGHFGPSGVPGGPEHFGPSGVPGGPGHFGPTGVEPPREQWYEGVQPVAAGGRSTRTYHPSDWHPQGPWRSELADPNFRASRADAEALRQRYAPYSKGQLDEFRRRGRIWLGEKEIAKLTDTDIQASELLLNDFVENMNRAFHVGDVRVEKHPVVRCAISAMHKMPNFDGTVHRGVRIRDPRGQQAFVDSHELGGTVRYKGFTHSDKKEVGGHRYEIMVHIESRLGKDMTYLRDPLQGIDEVIHLPHSDFYPVPVPRAHAPAGLEAGATKFQDADGRWHLFVRDHTGPYHPSEAMPPEPQPYPSFGPAGHDPGTDPQQWHQAPQQHQQPPAQQQQPPAQYQQQGGYEPQSQNWVPGDADFGRTVKAGFDPAFHHQGLGRDFAPGVHDPDGALIYDEPAVAERLEQEGWRVDARPEDQRVQGTRNPDAMVRKDPSDVGRITEFKTLGSSSPAAAKRAINHGSGQVPPVDGEVVVDGRNVGLTEQAARAAYRGARAQRGGRLASKIHIILGDGRMLTFVKEQ